MELRELKPMVLMVLNCAMLAGTGAFNQPFGEPFRCTF